MHLHRRSGLVVVADQSTQLQVPRPRKRVRFGCGIVVDLTFGRRVSTASAQDLAVESEVLTVGPIEADLIVALPILFHETGAQRQPHTLLARKIRCRGQGLPQCLCAKSMGVTAE